jgi:hypothetical protein
MHRWVWDLHYPAPDSQRHEYPISAIPGDTPRYPLGPTALPGSYSARLTANGKTLTAPFTIKMDPRVKTSTAALENKFQLEMRLSRIFSQTSKVVTQAGSMREPLQKLSEKASGALLDSIKSFQAKLASVVGGASGFGAPASDEITLARVNAQVAALYGQIWQADSEPTVAQAEAVTTVDHDALAAMQRWNAFMNSDLPALNRALHSANLPELQLESDSHQEESGMDEE